MTPPALDAGTSCGITDLPGFLQGTWRLARIIEDRRTQTSGFLRGRAVFTPHRRGLRCREQGRMRLGPHEGPTHRTHFYEFPRKDLASVLFDDGRPFHDLDLTGGRWHCTHLCGADRYRGEFLVLGADVLAVRWEVTGPRKDYALVSRYRRDAGAVG